MSDTLDRALGCFVGLAVGDALGAPLEFSKRDSLPAVTTYRAGGPFNLEAGYWTDDTSQALALADSLVKSGGRVDATDLLMRFAQWLWHGTYSSTGKCFDIGNQTRTAITDWTRDGSTVNGKGPKLQGNGAIMRLAPCAIAARDEVGAVELARLQTRTTHANSKCVQVSKAFAGVLWSEIDGKPCRNPGILELSRSKIKSTGHCVETLKAATWCVEKTSTFHDAVLLAANLGDDSDTVAAVTGQWAGARYGLSSFREDLLTGLHRGADLVATARRVFELREG